MIELALQPDFVDRWLIRVDDVWHKPPPSCVACGRSPRKRMTPPWCCHGDTKVSFGVLFWAATPDPARGRGRRLRSAAGPGACRKFSGCGLSPCRGRGTVVPRSPDL